MGIHQSIQHSHSGSHMGSPSAQGRGPHFSSPAITRGSSVRTASISK
ncbi:hypothetical protein OIU77_016827 [Salix suchowensis]|uniref:Uncharacterized protein n=1 Tax=Salix suchowensis TaxID=1278906 RepID=A0ABQ8ZLP3_9ROSI|nr:hypothetical protein OIU77_016827 [Salix suchowensis]